MFHRRQFRSETCDILWYIAVNYYRMAPNFQIILWILMKQYAVSSVAQYFVIVVCFPVFSDIMATSWLADKITHLVTECFGEG